MKLIENQHEIHPNDHHHHGIQPLFGHGRNLVDSGRNSGWNSYPAPQALHSQTFPLSPSFYKACSLSRWTKLNTCNAAGFDSAQPTGILGIIEVWAERSRSPDESINMSMYLFILNATWKSRWRAARGIETDAMPSHASETGLRFGERRFGQNS